MARADDGGRVRALRLPGVVDGYRTSTRTRCVRYSEGATGPGNEGMAQVSTRLIYTEQEGWDEPQVGDVATHLAYRATEAAAIEALIAAADPVADGSGDNSIQALCDAVDRLAQIRWQAQAEAIRLGTEAEEEDERILREEPDSAAADAIRFLHEREVETA